MKCLLRTLVDIRTTDTSPCIQWQTLIPHRQPNFSDSILKNGEVILVSCLRELSEYMCVRFPLLNLLQLQVQLQKKANNGLVLLIFLRDFLHKFLQKYDKWLHKVSQFQLIKTIVQFKYFVAVKMSVFLLIKHVSLTFMSESSLNTDTPIIPTLRPVRLVSVS